jgi:hypothetical protein
LQSVRIAVIVFITESFLAIHLTGDDQVHAGRHKGKSMLSKADRNNKGNVKAVDEGHTKRNAEPGARELRRKNMVKKVKRRK